MPNYVVKTKRGKRIVPSNYLSRRVQTLWRAGELKNKHVLTAAMFCYNERAGWIAWCGGTNWPRGYRVQTSVVVHGMKTMMTERKPPCYDRLSWLLTEELPFKDVALRCGVTGSKRDRHRKGKQILVQCLEECARFWEGKIQVTEAGSAA